MLFRVMSMLLLVILVGEEQMIGLLLHFLFESFDFGQGTLKLDSFSIYLKQFRPCCFELFPRLKQLFCQGRIVVLCTVFRLAERLQHLFGFIHLQSSLHQLTFQQQDLFLGLIS
jgi:hypothetical protein